MAGRLEEEEFGAVGVVLDMSREGRCLTLACDAGEVA